MIIIKVIKIIGLQVNDANVCGLHRPAVTYWDFLSTTPCSKFRLQIKIGQWRRPVGILHVTAAPCTLARQCFLQ